MAVPMAIHSTPISRVGNSKSLVDAGRTKPKKVRNLGAESEPV
jgi:hypothetical protein